MEKKSQTSIHTKSTSLIAILHRQSQKDQNSEIYNFFLKPL